jgi:hypothetical protein
VNILDDLSVGGKVFGTCFQHLHSFERGVYGYTLVGQDMGQIWIDGIIAYVGLFSITQYISNQFRPRWHLQTTQGIVQASQSERDGNCQECLPIAERDREWND